MEEKRPDGAATKIAQEPALELEENPQHLGDREDHLTMRDVEKERLPHPLTPLLKTLGMAGATKSANMLCTAYPRVLQDNVNRCSARQRGQRIRANPQRGLPQSR